jgi:hypothetical protein
MKYKMNDIYIYLSDIMFSWTNGRIKYKMEKATRHHFKRLGDIIAVHPIIRYSPDEFFYPDEEIKLYKDYFEIKNIDGDNFQFYCHDLIRYLKLKSIFANEENII